MSQPIILVCDDCLRKDDKVIGIFRPENEKETMDFQCARDGMRYKSGKQTKIKANGVEL